MLRWISRSDQFAAISAGRPVFCIKAKPWLSSWAAELNRFSHFCEDKEVRFPQNAVFLVDHSREGPAISLDMKAAFVKFADQLSIDCRSFFYISQNRLLEDNGFEPNLITWIPFDWWLHETIAQYSEVQPQLAPTVDGVERLFMCTNMKARRHRLAVLAFLYSDEMRGSAFWSLDYASDDAESYGYRTAKARAIEIEETNHRFPCARPYLTESFQKRVSSKVTLASERGRSFSFAQLHFHSAQPEIRKSLIDIVNESDFSGPKTTLRITEKTMRSIMLGRPFILVGNPGSLALLRRYGIQTGFGIVKDTYDNINNPAERMDAIFREIARLNRMYLSNPGEFLKAIDYEEVRRNRWVARMHLRQKMITEADARLAALSGSI